MNMYEHLISLRTFCWPGIVPTDLKTKENEKFEYFKSFYWWKKENKINTKVLLQTSHVPKSFTDPLQQLCWLGLYVTAPQHDFAPPCVKNSNRSG